MANEKLKTLTRHVNTAYSEIQIMVVRFAMVENNVQWINNKIEEINKYFKNEK